MIGVAKQKESNEGELVMNCQLIENKGKRYLHVKPLIQDEQEAHDIISLCIEHDVSEVLLEGGNFSDDFVKLRTGLVGAVLQKFGNYIKVAVTIEDKHNFPVRF
jgi:hypothetical protein